MNAKRDTPVPPEPVHQQARVTHQSQEMPARRISEHAVRMRSELEQLDPTPAAGTELALEALKYRAWEALLKAEAEGDIGKLFAAISLMSRQQGTAKLAQAIRLALAKEFGP